MEINPYSPPLADCPIARVVDDDQVLREMRGVARMYFGMGVIGIAAVAFWDLFRSGSMTTSLHVRGRQPNSGCGPRFWSC